MPTEYKTYPTARFHICDGFYTLEEIEDFVVQFRAAKQVQDKALKRSMDLTQENFEKVVAEMSASGKQVVLRPTHGFLPIPFDMSPRLAAFIEGWEEQRAKETK